MPRLLIILTLVLLCRQALPWGAEGHRVVGMLAGLQLTGSARTRLQEILGSEDIGVMAEACNWPDRYRATDEGAWSGPQHYINVPRGAATYRRERDCASGACSAEAIKRYARELGDDQVSPERRRQAWAWACHLAGDIHQPMHNGYGFDRGGNDYVVALDGREMNLHEFWDHALIGMNYPDWTLLPGDLAPLLRPVEECAWQPAQADAWIRESHELLRQYGYPDSSRVTREFAAQSWLLARTQLALAACRLAALVNAVLDGSPDTLHQSPATGPWQP